MPFYNKKQQTVECNEERKTQCKTITFFGQYLGIVSKAGHILKVKAIKHSIMRMCKLQFPHVTKWFEKGYLFSAF